MVGYVVDSRGVAVDMLVEVAEKYYLGAAALVMLNEFGEVVLEVVPWVCVFPFFLAECKFLLVIGCDARLICWFCTYLICRDKYNRFAWGSVEGDVRPSPVWVAVVALDSASYVALGEKSCASGFISGDCF